MRNEIEVMRVLRIPPRGELVVEVGNQRYQNLSEISEENLRHRLLAAVGELIIFTGGYKNLVDAGVAPPLAAAAETSAFPSAETADPSVPADQQARFLRSLEAERDLARTSSAARPRFPVLSGLQPSMERPADRDRGNIVSQIDAILQRHVAADPSLAGRSIHLQQSPVGGLRIEIDGEYFDRPLEIREQKIQLLIKRALKEWEDS